MIKITIDKQFFEEWKDKKVVMHCSKKEYAETFCLIMHVCGLCWRDDAYYANAGEIDTMYEFFKEDTCYLFNDGLLGSSQYYKNKNKSYTILEFEDFIIPESEPDTINEQWFNFWHYKPVVMHCKTIEEYKEFCSLALKYKYKYAEPRQKAQIAFLFENAWKTCKEKTCYELSHFCYDYIDSYIEDRYQKIAILEYEDYQERADKHD